MIPAIVSAFAYGETRVRIEADVQDADLYIVQPTSAPTNERLMRLALLADAAGSSRVTALVPYFGYARQERAHCAPPRLRIGSLAPPLAQALIRLRGSDTASRALL